MMIQQRPTIGFALGGGAARGIAHVGILQRLKETGIPIDYLAGTSAGALVGALYASDVSLRDIEQFALDLKWTDLFWPRPTSGSLLGSQRLIKLLQKLCPVSRIEDLHIPFAVVVTDFETGENISITQGELFPAVQASSSIPILCPPVRLNGRYYMDGGVSEEVPVRAVKKLGAAIAVACDVHHHADMLKKPANFISMAMHLGRMIAKKNAEYDKTFADLAINVDARGISLTDLQKSRELIQRGRQAVDAILPELQRLCDQYA
jgi:NTE family protein